jgi:hypothetical protein
MHPTESENVPISLREAVRLGFGLLDRACTVESQRLAAYLE